MQFYKTFFVVIVVGGLLVTVSSYSWAGHRLKIVAPEQYQYEAELDDLSDQGTVNFALNKSQMSVDIKNATLGYVLQEFSRVTGVDVHLPEHRSQEPVSLKFESLPLQKALQRILGENYALTFNSLNNNSDLSISELSNIRLVNREEVANKIAVNRRIEFISDALIERSLISGNNKERILALEALKLNGGMLSGDLLKALLSDDNSQIRQLALQHAESGIGNRDEVTNILNALTKNNSIAAVKSFAESALVTSNNGASSTAADEIKLESSVTTNNKDSVKTENKKDNTQDKLPSASGPLEEAILALKNGDDQTALEALKDIRRQNLNVDLDVLKEVASDINIGKEPRGMALEAYTNRLHPIEAKAFLVQKIEAESNPGVKRQYEYQLSKVIRDADLLHRIKL